MNWFKKAISKSFFVVFNFTPYGDDKEATARQLADNSLVGIEGISDQPSIALNWLGVARDAMLSMDATSLMKINNVDKVNYGDPHQLMANNMSNLKRLFNNNSNNGVLHRLLEYGLSSKKQPNLGDLYYFSEYCAFFQTLAWTEKEFPFQGNSPEDLAQWARQTSFRANEKTSSPMWSKEILENVSESDWLNIILDGLNLIGQIYHDEGEWVVQGKSLNIPPQSTLSILTIDIPDDILQDWRKGGVEKERLRYSGWSSACEENELITNLVKKYDLDRIYRIKFINRKEFDARRTGYFEKRDRK